MGKNLCPIRKDEKEDYEWVVFRLNLFYYLRH